jgi:aminopeptidase 2
MKAALLCLVAVASCAELRGTCVLNTTHANRLPYTVLPNLTSINLNVPNPNTGSLAYSGSVELRVSVVAATSCIVLHSHLLNWTASDAALSVNGKSTPIISVDFDTDNEFAIVSVASTLAVGTTASLKISFTAQFNSGPDGGSGFFLSNNSRDDAFAHRRQKPASHNRRRPFKPHPSLLHRIAAEAAPAAPSAEKMYGTQFEESDARRAFPCFDEPGFKTFVKTTITVPAGENITALSNYREVGPPVLDTALKTETTEFKTSKQRMSSYLVCFAVGRLDFVEQEDAGVRFRIYAAPGSAEYGRFALNFSIESVRFYSSSWDFEYSDMNDKMDQIAVPEIREDGENLRSLLRACTRLLLSCWLLCARSPPTRQPTHPV